jgi:virulence factor Mce-like protein
MRLLNAPRGVGRFFWRFINPQRTAGRVPLGRFVIVIQLIAALIFIGYTLTKKSIRLPFSSEPYEVAVVFADARGLDQYDEPAAAVAGTPLGRVTDVRYENGRSVATLTFEPEVEGKIFADATAAIRPGSAIQNLVVNVDPGDPDAGPLPEDQPIPPNRTEAFVAIDDLTGVLDADTRAYLGILISEAHAALRGRESELRGAVGELGELTDTAKPIARALRTRRELLTRLVGNLDVVFQTLGDRGAQLAEAINAGNHTLEVTAARETEVAELTRELGPTLSTAERSLAAVNQLTEPLLPALDQLVPAVPALTEGFRSVRAFIPQATALIGTFESLVDAGRRPLELMIEGTAGLPERIGDQISIAEELSALAARMDQHKAGVGQLSDTLSGALSVNDNGGTYGQVDVLPFEEPKPENFGLAASAARSDEGRLSLLDRKLASALEQACRTENVYACLLRFSVPGLPPTPVSGRGRRGG